MSRRDMIIVAVLMNTGLLAILFMMAVSSDDVTDQPELQQVIAEAPAPVYMAATPPPPVLHEQMNKPASVVTNVSSHDELDKVIKEYSANVPPTPVIIHDDFLRDAPPPVPIIPAIEPLGIQPKIEEAPKQVEIAVKRGDSLDKIARANGTSVKTLMKANNLSSDKLKIGQIIRVPVGETKTTTAKKVENKPKTSLPNKVGDGEFYTLKSGDNPWKIAKQFHVNFEDLLKLNNLDEEKARRMKAGDKIRVK